MEHSWDSQNMASYLVSLPRSPIKVWTRSLPLKTPGLRLWCCYRFAVCLLKKRCSAWDDAGPCLCRGETSGLLKGQENGVKRFILSLSECTEIKYMLVLLFWVSEKKGREDGVPGHLHGSLFPSPPGLFRPRCLSWLWGGLCPAWCGLSGKGNQQKKLLYIWGEAGTEWNPPADAFFKQSAVSGGSNLQACPQEDEI